MIRLNKAYTVSEIFARMPENFNTAEARTLSKQNFDGDMVNVRSARLVTFKKMGCKCVSCGIEGTSFYKEKHTKDENYHFNLYAYDANGEEVLMIKDHIVASSKGGPNNKNNYQPMCVRCNESKGDK